MARNVSGKSAVVTGAGSGINLEFARLLLEHGANVLFADLALRLEAEELVSRYQSKPKAVFQKTDVTSWKDLETMFKIAGEEFGSIDVVCPGAGIFEPAFSSFWNPPGTSQSKDDPLGDRYKIIDLNLTHPIRVTQMAISCFLSHTPSSSKDNPKTIVHISSIAGESSSLPFPLYSATKHGIVGFIRSLRDLQDLRGIRVAGVMPGMVKTPLFMENPEILKIVRQDGENRDQRVTPKEVAQVMLALVQDDEIPSSSREGAAMIPIKGGTLLEVLVNHVRDVPMFDNVGPYVGGVPGATVSDGAKVYKDVLDKLRPGWG